MHRLCLNHGRPWPTTANHGQPVGASRLRGRIVCIILAPPSEIQKTHKERQMVSRARRVDESHPPTPLTPWTPSSQYITQVCRHIALGLLPSGSRGPQTLAEEPCCSCPPPEPCFDAKCFLATPLVREHASHLATWKEYSMTGKVHRQSNASFVPRLRGTPCWISVFVDIARLGQPLQVVRILQSTISLVGTEVEQRGR